MNDRKSFHSRPDKKSERMCAAGLTTDGGASSSSTPYSRFDNDA